MNLCQRSALSPSASTATLGRRVPGDDPMETTEEREAWSGLPFEEHQNDREIR
jgi:hypothetical protein